MPPSPFQCTPGCPISLLLHPRVQTGILPAICWPLEYSQGSLVHFQAHWMTPFVFCYTLDLPQVYQGHLVPSGAPESLPETLTVL